MAKDAMMLWNDAQDASEPVRLELEEIPLGGARDGEVRRRRLDAFREVVEQLLHAGKQLAVLEWISLGTDFGLEFVDGDWEVCPLHDVDEALGSGSAGLRPRGNLATYLPSSALLHCFHAPWNVG